MAFLESKRTKGLSPSTKRIRYPEYAILTQFARDFLLQIASKAHNTRSNIARFSFQLTKYSTHTRFRTIFDTPTITTPGSSPPQQPTIMFRKSIKSQKPLTNPAKNGQGNTAAKEPLSSKISIPEKVVHKQHLPKGISETEAISRWEAHQEYQALMAAFDAPPKGRKR